MSRTIIVGDVHGCRRELERLLDKLGFGALDRLFLVGDLVGRGPDTIGVLELVLKLQAQSVRGNHEEKLIRNQQARGQGLPSSRLNRPLRQAQAHLTDGHWAFVESMPLWIDLPEHGVRLVHAGVVPTLPIEATEPRLLLNIRGLDEQSRPTELRGTHPWGALYQGPPHVVFGHNAQGDPQMHRWATGIDTGCVYGGRLTAMVLRDHETVPPIDYREDVLVSVPAGRAYCPIRRSLPAVP